MYKRVTITADIMSVSGIPSLVTFLKKIRF